MSRQDQEVLVRLSRINRDFGAVNRTLGELLAAVAEGDNAADLMTGHLPVVGRELISLAGELTRLGVDIAHWLDGRSGS